MMTLAKSTGVTRHIALLAVLVVCGMITATAPEAETLSVPGLTPDTPPKLDLGPCENAPYSQANCVRVLACIGHEGVHFDGQARGWDTGEVLGQLSTGAPCAGTWTSGGLFGTGHSILTCEGGMRAQVLYHTLHNETGTVEGSGIDSLGRRIQVWTGLNVLEFLEKETGKLATLPCGTGRNQVDVPIS
ncbi:hypothetical protein [Pseudaestuariivita sp.]|uniref:hypothetical protein n=1 Tax=Pseudaestuariivita sp. TaxID=2211669 RepID=UPI00405953FA